MEKRDLSERDICTKFITPAILNAGWWQSFFREEVKLTDRRVVVRGKTASRIKAPDATGGPKRADYILYADPHVPLAVVEAKRNVFPADGYWWLAFNWTNYCICGDLPNVKKNDVFPFADPTRATHSDPTSVDKECPIRIDPLVEEEARLISYEWRDVETCVAVQSGDVTPEQAARVDRTIEIPGLNRLPRLNEKQAQFRDKCKLAIADYKGAKGSSCFAKIEQAKATTTLKAMIKYDAEFSSVAEACVWKTAPRPLISAVFGH